MGDLLSTALLTCHGKAEAIAPPLAQAGYAVFTVDGFDTDSLGTFTGEVDREGTMLDAARRKAQLACSLSGARFGLGSEGSFGSDPWVGITPWGREILVWYDAREQLEISAFVQGAETNFASKCVATMDEALSFAAVVGFPQHGIIVGGADQSVFDKTCTTMSSFRASVRRALRDGPVELATDMRAHHNPRRMQMIGRCAQDLATRLISFCPQCHLPGFGAYAPVPGAICLQCARPSKQPRAVLYRCVSCAFVSEEFLRKDVIPKYCDYCNP